jgi:ketosteroid isomerase-like protein
VTDVLATLKAKQRAVRFFRFPGLSEGIVPEHQLAAKNAMATAGGRHVDATVDLIDGGLDAAYRAELGKSKRDQDKRVIAELSQDWLAAMRALVRRSETVGDRVAGADSPQVLRLNFDTITGDNLEALLGWLDRRGYRFAPAAEVLGHPIFSRPHSYTGRRGVSLYWRVRISDDLRRAEKEVNDLLFKAAESWSRGDLDGFMAAFTEDARIVSGRQLVEGRQTIRAKYRERYPTAGSMGRLAIELARFDIHTTDRETLYGLIEPIPPRFAIATVKWTLIPKRGMGRTGYASLALQKTNAGWRILEDHSSTGSFIKAPKSGKRSN